MPENARSQPTRLRGVGDHQHAEHLAAAVVVERPRIGGSSRTRARPRPRAASGCGAIDRRTGSASPPALADRRRRLEPAQRCPPPSWYHAGRC
jgi:hypothetical protein